MRDFVNVLRSHRCAAFEHMMQECIMKCGALPTINRQVQECMCM